MWKRAASLSKRRILWSQVKYTELNVECLHQSDWKKKWRKEKKKTHTHHGLGQSIDEYQTPHQQKVKWPEMMESFICLNPNRFPFICSFSMLAHTHRSLRRSIAKIANTLYNVDIIVDYSCFFLSTVLACILWAPRTFNIPRHTRFVSWRSFRSIVAAHVCIDACPTPADPSVSLLDTFMFTWCKSCKHSQIRFRANIFRAQSKAWAAWWIYYAMMV